jgi:uncharacterized protein YecE (DUF72 family)
MEYKVITSGSPEGLTIAVSNAVKDGWEPLGSHQVVLHHAQNRYSGSQHMDTQYKSDYSQTMTKKAAAANKIEVDILFYFPNNDEMTKIYDVEEMREDFENKLSNLIK